MLANSKQLPIKHELTILHLHDWLNLSYFAIIEALTWAVITDLDAAMTSQL